MRGVRIGGQKRNIEDTGGAEIEKRPWGGLPLHWWVAFLTGGTSFYMEECDRRRND